jgi:hypothetical protein
MSFEEKLTQELKTIGAETVYVFEYFDGFSAGFMTELEAYKAAYHYRNCGDVTVKRLLHQAAKWQVSLKKQIKKGA